MYQQSKNIVNGSMFFVFKIRLYIQVMHKILYIKPYLEGKPPYMILFPNHQNAIISISLVAS